MNRRELVRFAAGRRIATVPANWPRAAALLAADRLLQMAGPLADSGSAQRPRKFGASVAVQRLEDEFEGVPSVVLAYRGNWLGEALRLAPGGEIVDLTLVPALLGSVPDRCASAADSAARAIESTPALSGGKPTTSLSTSRRAAG